MEPNTNIDTKTDPTLSDSTGLTFNQPDSTSNPHSIIQNSSEPTVHLHQEELNLLDKLDSPEGIDLLSNDKALDIENEEAPLTPVLDDQEKAKHNNEPIQTVQAEKLEGDQEDDQHKSNILMDNTNTEHEEVPLSPPLDNQEEDKCDNEPVQTIQAEQLEGDDNLHKSNISINNKDNEKEEQQPNDSNPTADPKSPTNQIQAQDQEHMSTEPILASPPRKEQTFQEPDNREESSRSPTMTPIAMTPIEERSRVNSTVTRYSEDERPIRPMKMNLEDMLQNDKSSTHNDSENNLPFKQLRISASLSQAYNKGDEVTSAGLAGDEANKFEEGLSEHGQDSVNLSSYVSLEKDPVTNVDMASMPLADRLKASHWKIRSKAFEELRQKLQETENGGNTTVFDDYSHVFVNFLKDPNAIVQEKALEAFRIYAQKKNISHAESRDTIKAILEKVLAGGRPQMRKLCVDILVEMYGKPNTKHDVKDGIKASLKQKNVKIVWAAMQAFLGLMEKLKRSELQGFEEVFEVAEKMAESSVATQREKAMGFYKMAYKYMGDDIRKYTARLKKKQAEELEQWFDKGEEYEDMGEDNISINNDGMDMKGSMIKTKEKESEMGIMEENSEELSDRTDRKKYDETWCEKVMKEPKWEERKKMLEEFLLEAEKLSGSLMSRSQSMETRVGHVLSRGYSGNEVIGTERSNTSSGNYNESLRRSMTSQSTQAAKNINGWGPHITSMLKRLLNDNNMQVMLVVLRIYGVLALNLRKGFAPVCRNTLILVFHKLKEKHVQVVQETMQTLNDYLICIAPEDMIDSMKESLADKSPILKANILTWLERHLTSCSLEPPASLSKCSLLLKGILPSLKKLTEDGSPEVREISIRLLAFIAVHIPQEKEYGGLSPSKLSRITELATTMANEKGIDLNSNFTETSAYASKTSTRSRDTSNQRLQKSPEGRLELRSHTSPGEITEFRSLTTKAGSQKIDSLRKARTKQGIIRADTTGNEETSLSGISEKRCDRAILLALGVPERIIKGLEGVSEVINLRASEDLYMWMEENSDRVPKEKVLNALSADFREMCEVSGKEASNRSKANGVRQIQRSKTPVTTVERTFSYNDIGSIGLKAVDISRQIETHVRKLSDADWKVRKDALEAIEAVMEENAGALENAETGVEVDILKKTRSPGTPSSRGGTTPKARFNRQESGISTSSITSGKRVSGAGLQELITALRARLNEHNKSQVRTFLAFIAKLATYLGSGVKVYARILVMDIAKNLSDKQQAIRQEAVRALDSIAREIGSEMILGILIPMLDTESPEMRTEILSWILKNSDVLSKLELKQYSNVILIALQDKTKEIRNLAEMVLEKCIEIVGTGPFFAVIDSMKPAASSMVRPFVEKYSGKDIKTMTSIGGGREEFRRLGSTARAGEEGSKSGSINELKRQASTTKTPDKLRKSDYKIRVNDERSKTPSGKEFVEEEKKSGVGSTSKTPESKRKSDIGSKGAGEIEKVAVSKKGVSEENKRATSTKKGRDEDLRKSKEGLKASEISGTRLSSTTKEKSSPGDTKQNLMKNRLSPYEKTPPSQASSRLSSTHSTPKQSPNKPRTAETERGATHHEESSKATGKTHSPSVPQVNLPGNSLPGRSSSMISVIKQLGMKPKRQEEASQYNWNAEDQFETVYEYLRVQIKENVNNDLYAKMYSDDVKKHIEAIQTLKKLTVVEFQGTFDILDLILRWLFVRLHRDQQKTPGTSPEKSGLNRAGAAVVFTKEAMDYILGLVLSLEAAGCTLLDMEAEALLECLVQKAGMEPYSLKITIHKVLQKLGQIYPFAHIIKLFVPSMCSGKAKIRSQATILLVDAVKTYGKEIVLENMDVFQDLLTSENEDVGKNAWKALGEIELLVGHEVVSVIKEQAGDEVCEKLGRVEPKGKKESPLKPRSSEKAKKQGAKESYRSNYREKEIEIVKHRQEEGERKSVKEQQARDKEEVVAGEVEEQGNGQETEEDKNLSLEAEERKEVNVKLEENEENEQGFTQELQEKKEKIGDKSPSSPRKRIDVKFDKSMELLKEETISSKLEGLLQLQDLITWDARPNQELLKRQGNMLVLELAHILGSVYGKSSSEVPTKFMLIFLTMTQKLCGIKPFLKDIKEEPLKVLCEEIWKRLVIEGTESQNQETKFLVKTLTSTVLKLLENSNPNIMFSILFQSLAQAKINRDSPRLIQLITTCILKMTKTLSHYIDALEPTALLLNMHIFLLECESNNVYQAQDDPTKATKNLLTELARTYRQKLWSYYLQGVDQHPRTDRYIQGWIATLVGPKPLEESPHNKDSASYNALRKSLGAKASHNNNRTTPIESLRDADQTLEKDSSPRALKTISKISKEGEYKSPSTSSSKVLYGTKGYESLGPESKSTQEFTHEKGKKSGVWSRESQTSRVDTGHSKYSVTNLKSPSKHVLNTSYTSVDKSLGSTGLNASTKAVRGTSGIKNRDKSSGTSATEHKKQASISVDEGDPIGNLSAVKSIEPQSTPNKIVAGSKVSSSKTPTLGSTRNISHSSSTVQGLGHRKGAKSISEGDMLRKSMTLERTLTDIKKSALMDEQDKHEETKTPDNPHNINEKVSNIKRRYGIGKTRLEKTTVTTNTEPEGSLSKRSLEPSRASPRPWEVKSSLTRKSGVNSSLSASGRKSARDTSNELESRNLGKSLKSKDETVEAKSAKNIGQRFADLKAKVKTMINKK